MRSRITTDLRVIAACWPPVSTSPSRAVC